MTPVRTLSPLRQGRFSRLAGFAPPHALALVVCVLALLLGVAVADDYGVWVDTYQQRAIGEANLRHLAGENGLNLLWPPSDRLYGPIVEMPLRLIERAFFSNAADPAGPADSRSVYLVRYLLTHLLFLAAGFAGYLLVRRLFGSRWLALFALLLFLLHPRIYAHSFFNSKDVPFFAMFMICLWLGHRAFDASATARSDAGIYGAAGTAGAFALCGVAAGLLVNLRIIGLVFVALVAFMCLCDVFAAGSRDERRRTMTGTALFTLTAAVTFYATMPYLWADPLTRFLEISRVMSAHPANPLQLFQGKLVYASEVPPSYLPVWFGITTPPLALLLGAVGLAALVWRVARERPRLKAMLGNTSLRFELLIAACFVVPVLAVVALQPTHYGEGRQFYFLWAPLVLLATSGLRALAEGAWQRFLPGRVPAILTTRFGIVVAGGLATFGVSAMAVEMARLHPHQHLYFNVLSGWPGAAVPLRQRFYLADEFGPTHGYAHLLEELADPEQPDAVFNIWRSGPGRKERNLARLGIATANKDLELFRPRDQRRFAFDPNADPDFYVRGVNHVLARPGARFPPLLYERRAYGQLVVRVATPDLSRVDATTANAYRMLYRDVTSSTPTFAGNVDVYRDETAITWVKEPCPPGDLHHAMAMAIEPLDTSRGPNRGLGREGDTRRADGVRIGNACLWQAPLPDDQTFARIFLPGIGTLASNAYLEKRRRRHAALAATPPAARSTFDVYLQEGMLFYVKTPCVHADTEPPFFVHVRPVHLGDLPGARRELGFAVLDFQFGGLDPHGRDANGDLFDGICMATLDLPDYPVLGIATGQYTPGGASLWRVDVDGK